MGNGELGFWDMRHAACIIRQVGREATAELALCGSQRANAGNIDPCL